MSWVRRFALVVISAHVMLAIVSGASAQKLDVAAVARSITDGAGKVGTISGSGTPGPIFVFEENHISRIGQHQIAIMLNRLYLGHGMRQIGLEGLTTQTGQLDAKWFHQVGGETGPSVREDVAVRMLGEGEIIAPEMMALVHPDIKVLGIETEEEYAVKPGSGQAPVNRYLISITEQKMTQEQIKAVNELVSHGERQAAFELIMSSDPRVQQHFQNIEHPTTPSIEVTLSLLREIDSKACEMSARIAPDARRGMEDLLQYYVIASGPAKPWPAGCLTSRQPPRASQPP